MGDRKKKVEMLWSMCRDVKGCIVGQILSNTQKNLRMVRLPLEIFLISNILPINAGDKTFMVSEAYFL